MTALPRAFEVVGYVIGGRAELYVEGQRVLLRAGDSYLLPRSKRHAYRILEPFTVVEILCIPSEIEELVPPSSRRL
jgi:quercetin dioxygenase-like cupin family protein